MVEVTPLGAAVLGLVMERPMHPYEMFQLLLERDKDELLKIKPGSLYHAVDRLATQGLIEEAGTEREGNRPERTRYTIKPEGYEALHGHVSQLLREVVNEYPGFRRGIAEAHDLPVEQVVALLRERQTALREKVDATEAHLATSGPERRQFLLNYEYSLAMLQAELAWLENIISELDQGDIIWSIFPQIVAEAPHLLTAKTHTLTFKEKP